MSTLPHAVPVPPLSVSARRGIAPAWHTLLVLAFVGFGSVAGLYAFNAPAVATPYTVRWLGTASRSWLLLGAVVAGLYSRSAFLRSVLDHESRPWWNEAATTAAVYLACITPGTIVSLLISRHVLHLVPISSQPVLIGLMAPQTCEQLGIWFLVSLSAGICEEIVFRGYLLKQLAAYSNVPMAIVFSSLLFGLAHSYQGAASVIAITLLGAISAVVAITRGNLRTVIAAHILIDSISGIVLFHRPLH